MNYSVTIKIKSRLSKNDNWDSISTSSFSTILKANTFQYNQRLKYKGFDGKVDISDNYTNDEQRITS